MIKLLIGGSPCTHWSIAQKNNRETEPEGLGWELFKNYLIAKEKFKPDFFLYENNKSAAQPIKDQIAKELGVDLMYINSALVSAQNRQRFYAFNWEVEQPEDRGIFLKDILERGESWREKSLCIDACYYKGGNLTSFKKQSGMRLMAAELVDVGHDLTGNDKAYALTTTYGSCVPHDTIKRKRRSMIAEPVRIPEYGTDKARPINAHYSNNCGGFEHRMFSENPNKQQVDMIAEPINMTKDGKSKCIRATYYKDGIRDLIANDIDKRTCVAEPVRVVALPRPNGELSTSQAMRVYGVDGKSVTLSAGGGGMGGKTGLYACPYELSEEYYKGGADSSLIGMTTNGEGKYRNGSQPSQQYRVYSCEGKSQVVNTLGNENYIMPGTKKQTPVYKVKNGLITIKGKQYPIKLADGHYIIRKLTPVECERLQTLPDNYTAAVSNAQRYKGLGNGWTAEVIIHILNGALKDVPRDEEIVVLSMYDGIGTGRYCLDKMGFTNVKYYAYEIDKYAKQVAMSNYPDIIQCGDAFDLRHPDWTIGY